MQSRTQNARQEVRTGERPPCDIFYLQAEAIPVEKATFPQPVKHIQGKAHPI